MAHYTGNVRLWQTANVVRAPKIDFDNEKRTIVAESDNSQTVSSFLSSRAQDGKLTPVDVTADKLTYDDEQRLARYTGNVFAKTPTGTVSAEQIGRLPEAGGSGEQGTGSAGPGGAQRASTSGLERTQPDRSHDRHRTSRGDGTESPRCGRPAGLHRR